MKDSSRNSPGRSLLALVVVLGLTFLILKFTNDIYYEPICKRHAESQGLTFWSYSQRWVKQDLPAECFFRDRNKNLTRVDIAEIPKTSNDWMRWLLTWIATIAGVGGAVWLASLIGGFKPGRRRR